MKNLIGLIIGLYFTRNNIVVIDTLHGLIHFPQLTMQAKNDGRQASAKHQLVLIHGNITVTAFADHPSDGNAIVTVTSVGFYGSRECANIPHNFNIN